LLGALQAVSKWLSGSGVEFAVIGGVAASLRGRPRVTKDVDLVAFVDENDWASLLRSGAKRGIVPRIDNALDFARTTRVLLLVHEPTHIEVDLSFGLLPFESELVQRAEVREIHGVRFPLATAEDVIVMKALALRPRDVADIEGIVESVADLDLDRIRATVATLSAALEGEDHLSRLDEILRAVRR
jgi:predicted nucleotidyltransferase